MTVGIVLQNSYGAALGADTVVLNSTKDGRRFLPGADKIFDLTSRAPAGLMVCGSMHFADVAWGPLTTFVRRRLQDVESFTDIANRVITYLSEDPVFDPGAKQRAWEESLQIFLTECLQRAESWVVNLERNTLSAGEHAYLQSNLDLTRSRTEDFILLAAQRGLNDAMDRPARVVDPGLVHQVVKNNRDRVDAVVDRVFPSDEDATFTARDRERLEILLAQYSLQVANVRLMFVGYARDEKYPTAVEVRLYGQDGADLHAEARSTYRITRSSDAHLIPIGQSEEIEAFLSGIHPDVVPALAEKEGAPLRQLMVSAATIVKDEFGGQVDGASLNSALSRLNREFADLDVVWREQWDRRGNRLRRSTTEGLALLPKQVLAEAADTLLSQAILRRTLTVDSDQSIGGFIEVAVISREGGFDLVKSPRLARIPLPRRA